MLYTLKWLHIFFTVAILKQSHSSPWGFMESTWLRRSYHCGGGQSSDPKSCADFMHLMSVVTVTMSNVWHFLIRVICLDLSIDLKPVFTDLWISPCITTHEARRWNPDSHSQLYSIYYRFLWGIIHPYNWKIFSRTVWSFFGNKSHCWRCTAKCPLWCQR